MNELIKIPFGTPTRVALDLPPGLTELEWKQVGHNLLRCKDSLQFWIGDWINYGQAAYGKDYAEAMKVFGAEGSGEYGYEQHTLENFASVARSVEISRRREKLSFGHHEAVAAYPAKDQSYWLGVAEEDGLTVHELRLAVRKKLRLPETAKENTTAGHFIWEAWLATQATKLQKQLEAMPVGTWQDDVLAARIRGFDRMEKPLRDEASRRGLKV